MRMQWSICARYRSLPAALLAVLLLAPTAKSCWTQSAQSSSAPGPATSAASPIVLDRAVAVVNRHVILASDLDEEIRLSILDPNNAPQQNLTRQQALEKLISRTLIEQQIRQEDMPAIEPSREAVNARLHEMRTGLPICLRQDCASDSGWKAFLTAHALTEQRVNAYLRYRLEILSFIEQRFRQGIQISEQQIETYYHDTLAPEYGPGVTVPPLAQVSSRIQEILLQQEVNELFDNWLTNLRQQGDVEILDPDLVRDPAPSQTPSGPHTAERLSQ